jgi:alpha-methylacyl-CoA racemase
LADADTCVAPVLRVAELPASPNVVERGLLIEAHHPVHGSFQQLAPVLAGMLVPTQPVEVPDLAVTSTEALLERAGVDAPTIATWRSEGVIG